MKVYMHVSSAEYYAENLTEKEGEKSLTNQYQVPFYFAARIMVYLHHGHKTTSLIVDQVQRKTGRYFCFSLKKGGACGSFHSS